MVQASVRVYRLLVHGFGLVSVAVGAVDRALPAFAMLMSSACLVCAVGLADVSGWKCDGATHCAPNQPCSSPGLGGNVSCTMTTPINHQKCVVDQTEASNCATVQRDCARIQVYYGGTCDMGPVPKSCPTGSPGAAYTIQEDGC